MLVYKYRAINDDNIRALSNNQIYASLFSKLNDPAEGTYSELISPFVDFVEHQFKTSGFAGFKKDIVQIQNYKNTLGICSLSKTSLNELMWSRYADCHKGYCLEYDIEKLKEKYIIPLRVVNQIDVKYLTSPPILRIDDINYPEIIFQKMFGSKLESWIKEDEVRLIFDSDGLKEYHPSALTGVYFGIEMKESDKEIIMNHLDGQSIKFYSMSFIPNSCILKSKLIKETKGQYDSILDGYKYEIICTIHQPACENFHVLYKMPDKDEGSLKDFITKFKRKYSTKTAIINLYDTDQIKGLIDKYPLSTEEELLFSEHFIASDMGIDFIQMYPFK